MLYNLSNEYDLAKFDHRVEELRNKGKWVELTLKDETRSESQNRYLHKILGYFAQEFGYTLDEVKVDIFKRLCNRAIFERVVVNKRGMECRTLRSSASLTTAEMVTAIDRFRNYSASECGLYIPSPNESGLLMYAEQQIQKNK